MYRRMDMGAFSIRLDHSCNPKSRATHRAMAFAMYPFSTELISS